MKNKIQNLSVLIVGGGLAGLSCAIRMTQMGHKVTLWDKDKSVKRKVCGEYLSPLGVKCAFELGHQDVLKDFEPIYGMNLTSPNQAKVETNFPSGYGISLNRKAVEESLWQKAKDLGVSLIRGEMIKEINTSGEGWNINGIYGDLLVGADGRQSLVAKKLGFQKNSNDKKISIHIYVKRKSDFQRRGEMIVLGNGGYIGINPINSSEDNVSWVGDQSVFKKWKNKESFAQSLLQHPRLKDLYGEEAEYGEITSVAKISHRVRDIVTHNAVLIGDAAGFIDPLTGEGMTRAFECTKILSDSLKTHTNLRQGLLAYKKTKNGVTKDKNRLNLIFQMVIKSSFISNLVGYFLAENNYRADTFIGIIGNVYSPITGLGKILFGSHYRSSI